MTDGSSAANPYHSTVGGARGAGARHNGRAGAGDTKGLGLDMPTDSTWEQAINGVIERLLDLREKEAPLGHKGYRGPFTQKAIAKIAGVPVETVTRMAIGREGRQLARQAMAFEIVDSRTVRDGTGRDHDVLEAIGRLPWVEQLCPLMPHEYVHQRKLDENQRHDFAVVARMLRADNPESYRAYYRGYPQPTRYWEAPDGQRYWLTAFMINRCWPDSVPEGLRLVKDGAHAIPNLEGPPWAPIGTGHLYEQTPKGSWRPTMQAVADGHQPCNASACKGLRKNPR